MHKKQKKQWIGRIGTGAIAAVMSLSLSMEAVASDVTATASDASGNEADVSPATTDRDILSMRLPVDLGDEPSPLDFILDPCGLLYETDAIRYGGGMVEEGATMLFYNEEGEEGGYSFSSFSDMLTVMNQGKDPVMVTVSASVSDLEGIALAWQDEFSEDEDPSIYLALVDDYGNEQPISEEEGATICMEIDPGEYSFGLTGACDPDADWKEVGAVHPKVTVTWHVEPVEKEEEAPEGLGEKPDLLGTAQADSQEKAQPGTVPGGAGGAGGQSTAAEDLGGQAGAQPHPDGAADSTSGQGGTSDNASGQGGADSTPEAPAGPDGAGDGASGQKGDGVGDGTFDQDKEAGTGSSISGQNGEAGTDSGTSDQDKGEGTDSGTSDQNKGNKTGCGTADQNQGEGTGSGTSDQNRGDSTGSGTSGQNQGDSTGSGASDQNKGAGTGSSTSGQSGGAGTGSDTSDQSRGDSAGGSVSAPDREIWEQYLWPGRLVGRPGRLVRRLGGSG